jgi:hypothetical protein
MEGQDTESVNAIQPEINLDHISPEVPQNQSTDSIPNDSAGHEDINIQETENNSQEDLIEEFFSLIEDQSETGNQVEQTILSTSEEFVPTGKTRKSEPSSINNMVQNLECLFSDEKILSTMNLKPLLEFNKILQLWSRIHQINLIQIFNKKLGKHMEF